MTTIAFRDGLLAADSMCSTGGKLDGDVVKIAKRHDGWLCGGAGRVFGVKQFMDWFCEGDKDKPYDIDLEADCFTISPEGRVYLVGGKCTAVECDNEFHAWGSGANFAIGAMAMGASAQRAVGIASLHDATTGGQITVLTCGPEKAAQAVKL